MNKSITNMQPHVHNPVGLLKISKLGVLGSNMENIWSGQTRKSQRGFNVGRGTGATVSRAREGASQTSKW